MSQFGADRGGLDYRIEVSGDFSTLERFKQEARRTRDELNKLKTGAAPRGGRGRSGRSAAARQAREEADAFDARTAAIRKYNRETRRQATAQTEANVAQNQNFNNERRRQTSIERQQRAERDVTKLVEKRRKAIEILNAAKRQGVELTEKEKISQGLASRLRTTKKLTEEEKTQRDLKKSQVDLENEQLRMRRAEIAANKAQARAQERQQRDQILSSRGLDSRGNAIPVDPARRAGILGFFDDLTRKVNRSDSSVNRISFTFRRLFGILAAFTAARVLAGQIALAVAEMVRFNARIEQAELGIASLITATAQISDTQGQATTAAEGFVLAQKEARRQAALLRREGLATAATFSELLETFQSALAPGLQAGLGIDEIRAFTVRISQAAAALELPQNQLAEEIRSILQGTIQARNTRIATALGITNADIRRAREAGELFEFLQDKFSAFAEAEQVALQNFSVIVTNLKDAFSQVLGAGGEGFFEETKNLLSDITRSLVDMPELGQKLRLNPVAVQFVRNIADGLERAALAARRTIDNLDGDDFLATAEAIGNTIGTTAEVAIGAVEGIGQGLNDIFGTAQELKNLLLGEEGAFSSEGYQETASWIARILTILITMRLTVGFITKAVQAIKKVLSLLGGLSRPLRAIRSIVLVIGAPFLVIAGILASIASIAYAIYVNFDDIQAVAKKLGLNVDFLDGGVASILEAIKNMPGPLEVIKQKLDQIKAAWDSISGSIENAVKATAKYTLGLIPWFSEGEKAADMFAEEYIRGLKKYIPDVEKVAKDLGIAQDDLLSLADEFDATFSGPIDALEESNKQVDDLRDKTRKLVDDYARTLSLDNIPSPFREIIETQIRSRQEAKEFNRDLDQAADKLNNDLAIAQTRMQDILANAAGFSKTEFGFFLSLESSFDKMADIQARITDLGQSQTDDAKKRREELEKELSLQQAKTRSILSQARGALGEDNALRIAQAARDDAKLRTKQIVLNRRLGEIDQQRLDANRAIAEQANLETSADAVEQTREATKEYQNLLIEQAQRRAQIEAQNLGPAQQRVALAQSELDIAERRNKLDNERYENGLRELRAERQRGINAAESLRQDLAINRAKLQTPEIQERINTLSGQYARQQNTNAELARLIAAREKNRELIQARQNDEAKQLELRLRVAQQTAERPVQFGLKVGLTNLENQFTSAEARFRATIDTMTNIVQSFSSTVADLIVSAFDPTSDASIEERLGRFLQGIAQQIIQTLVQIATVQAVLGLTGLFGFGGATQNVTAAALSSGTSAAGAAEGGPVSGPEPSVRPRGLDPRDTVPMWLDPREWVIKGNSVSKYGRTVMDRINRGLVDPRALRAVAGVTSGSSYRRTSPKSLGLAEGGAVPSRGSKGGNAGASGGSGLVVQPTIVANDSTLEKLLSGGRNAFIAAIEANKTDIRGIVNSG